MAVRSETEQVKAHPQPLLLLGMTASCGWRTPLDKRDCAPGENFLLIISDDIGIDKTSTYGEFDSAPPTPNLDALAAQGLLFRNAYATPTCSPTRASLLTGRMPTRTGIGRWLYPGEAETDLLFQELTIPELLRHSPACYTSAIEGKWHLVMWDRDQPAMHPLNQGFDEARGALANLGNAYSEDDGLTRGNYHWEKNTDGELSWSDTYSAIDTTDEALSFLQTHEDPWFLVVSYNLAHVPVDVPPERLNLAGVTEASSDLEKYEANVQALDAEVGRLLAGLSPEQRANTTIVYLSDNGTDADWLEPPSKPYRGKGTVFDGGVRVPFIVAGPHVTTPGAETEALVHVVDLFPTLAELAGVDVSRLTVEQGDARGSPLRLDGVSFLPILEDPDGPGARDTVFTEGFFPNGDEDQSYHYWMLRDAQWKLTRHASESLEITESFFRYTDTDIDEGSDLLPAGLTPEDQEAYERLSDQLDEITADLFYGY